jgi:hypothetical protein
MDREGEQSELVRKPKEARPDGQMPSPNHHRYFLVLLYVQQFEHKLRFKMIKTM